LPKKLKQFQTVGSFEDFIGLRFTTLIISHCKTENPTGALFDQQMIDYLMSKLKIGQPEKELKIFLIAKASCLNQVWKDAFVTKNTEMISR